MQDPDAPGALEVPKKIVPFEYQEGAWVDARPGHEEDNGVGVKGRARCAYSLRILTREMHNLEVAS